MPGLKALLKETRPPFLTASVLPVFIGAGCAYWLLGVFDPWLFIATLAGMVLLHAGANAANGYFDFLGGTDLLNRNRNPFSGGTGQVPGKISPESVHGLSLLLFALGGAFGAWLFLARGPLIITLGLAGAASGYLYVHPKANLAGRALGELLVGLNFGLLPVLGSYFVQTGSLVWEAVAASIPPSFLITAVLWINQFPDYEADKGTGKHNLVVRIGRERSSRVHASLFALAYASLALTILLGLLPFLALAAFIPFPLALKSALVSRKSPSFPGILPANASAVLAHLLTGALLAGALFISAIL